MSNDDIPHEVWELKNSVLEYMEKLTSNHEYYRYKELFTDFAHVCQSNGKKNRGVN